MKRKPLAAMAAFGLLAQHAAFAKQAAGLPSTGIQITWEELAGVVVEKKISAVLPDGARVEGEVLAVRPESMVIDVQKSSKKKLHPKGQSAIPRESFTELRLIRERSAAGRIVGGILGAVGGIYASTGLALATDSLAVFIPAMLLIIPASAVGGYYAGKLADRRTTRISIRPAVAVLAGAEE